jgi:hypothetical protein
LSDVDVFDLSARYTGMLEARINKARRLWGKYGISLVLPEGNRNGNGSRRDANITTPYGDQYQDYYSTLSCPGNFVMVRNLIFFLIASVTQNLLKSCDFGLSRWTFPWNYTGFVQWRGS